MLGIKRRLDVLEILRELAEAGIEIHTQVVLCPGWNDGAVLEQTCNDLLGLAGSISGDGGIRSLAIVPVGLSAHRKGLTQLDPVSPDVAHSTIDSIHRLQEIALSKTGERFVYLSDEFYLLADQPFPAPDHYDEFWQVDNAIGLTPRLAQTWQQELIYAKQEGRQPQRPLTILTGELAAKAWQREFLPLFKDADAPPIQVIPVVNSFYGHSVTVAGLLSGHDLREALLDLPKDPVRTVVLSPRVLNSDGLTLDGMNLIQIASDQPHEVLVGEEDGFVDFWVDLG